MIEKALFKSLDLPSKEGLLKAEAIKKNSRFFVCKSSDGLVNFLIKTNGKTDSNPYNLKHIDVHHNKKYEIEENKKFISIICTHIKCKSDSASISNIFFEQIHTLSHLIKETDSDKIVGKKLDNLIEIFKNLNKPSIKTIRGLWAELFIINSSTNMSMSVNAWHQDNKDRYDFSSEHMNLEIKSRNKLKPIQAHFSMNQINPPDGTKKAIVCSVYVNSNSSGLSVMELREQIKQKIKSNGLKEKLDNNFYKILGKNINHQNLDEKFDIGIASKNCYIYELEKIPQIAKENIPKEIIEYSFKVDLTNLESPKINKLKKYPLIQNLKNILT